MVTILLPFLMTSQAPSSAKLIMFTSSCRAHQRLSIKVIIFSKYCNTTKKTSYTVVEVWVCFDARGLCISQFQLRPCPPPRANPRALAFCSLGWQIPGGGDTLAAKCPVVGTKEEGKCPAPGIVCPQSTLQQVFIHCTKMPLSAFFMFDFSFL